MKVADAALSRDVYELEYYRPGEKAQALPVKWMSPEALEHGLCTAKGDVVSAPGESAARGGCTLGGGGCTPVG